MARPDAVAAAARLEVWEAMLAAEAASAVEATDCCDAMAEMDATTLTNEEEAPASAADWDDSADEIDPNEAASLLALAYSDDDAASREADWAETTLAELATAIEAEETDAAADVRLAPSVDSDDRADAIELAWLPAEAVAPSTDAEKADAAELRDAWADAMDAAAAELAAARDDRDAEAEAAWAWRDDSEAAAEAAEADEAAAAELAEAERDAIEDALLAAEEALIASDLDREASERDCAASELDRDASDLDFDLRAG